MMTYEYDPELNIIHLHATEILVRDDTIAYFHQIAKDTAVKPGAIERVYFQKLVDIAFTYTDIEQIREAFDRLEHSKRLAYTVFITNSDLTYGMARMIVSIFDHPSHEFRIERED